MATRIRRAGVAVGLALLMVTALAGVGGQHDTLPQPLRRAPRLR